MKSKLREFTEYMDTLTQENGDNAGFCISWSRAGNNRRKVMEKNKSSFTELTLCAWARRPPPKENPYIHTFENFRVCGETIDEMIDAILPQIKEYINRTYYENKFS